MSWMDEELDDLFREQAADHSVQYKDEYWKEFEGKHLNNRRDSGAWLFTAVFFTSCLVLGTLMPIGGEDISGDESNHPKSLLVYSNSMGSLSENEKNVADSKASEFDITQSEKNRDIASERALNISFGSKEIPSNKETHRMAYVESRNINPTQQIDPSDIDFHEEDLVFAEIKTEDLADLSEDVNLMAKEAGLEEIIINDDLLPYKNYRAPKAHRFYVEGTMGVAQSMISGLGLVSNNYGIGFGSKFSHGRFVAQVGLNASIANHSEMLLTRSSKIYGFGSEEYKADIDYAQLYNIGLSTSFGMRFGKSTVYAGGNLNFLAATKSYIYEYSVNTLSSNAPTYQRSTVLNYMDGLSRLTGGVYLGASREFSPGIEMGINLGFQLNNNFDKTVIEELNMTPFRGLLYIRKTF